MPYKDPEKQKAYKREQIRRNPEGRRRRWRRYYYRHRERLLADKRRKNKIVRDYINSQKTSCAYCGFSDFRALEFHHVTGKTKEISLLLQNYNLSKLQEEIAKCIVLCSNCHAIEHYGQKPKERQPWLKLAKEE